MRLLTTTIKKLMLGLLLVGAVACSESASEYPAFSEAVSAITAANVNQDDVIVVIPGEGCGGCISNATSFMYEKVDEAGIKVVFTGVEDKKLLALQLGDDFLARDNVYLDSDNLFMHQELKSIYPRILTTKNGSVDEVIDFDSSFFSD